MNNQNRTYREENGRFVRGIFLEAVIRSGQYSGEQVSRFDGAATHIKVYEDGIIDCWKLVDLDGFKELLKNGWVVTSIPEGAHLYLGESVGVHLTAIEVTPGIDPDDLVGQVEDEIRALRGEPTTSDLCIEAYLRYRDNPTEANRALLQAAYEKVPRHLREYLTLASAGEYVEDDIRTILGLGDYSG